MLHWMFFDALLWWCIECNKHYNMMKITTWNRWSNKLSDTVIKVLYRHNIAIYTFILNLSWCCSSFLVFSVFCCFSFFFSFFCLFVCYLFCVCFLFVVFFFVFVFFFFVFSISICSFSTKWKIMILDNSNISKYSR